MTFEQVDVPNSNPHEGLKEALQRGDIDWALNNQVEVSEQSNLNIEEAIVGWYELVEKVSDPDSAFPSSPEFTREMAGILDKYLSA